MRQFWQSQAPPVGQVLNLVVTAGDNEGSLDVAWDRDRSARSYEVQTSPDPATASSWVARLTAPKSSTTLAGLSSGARIWVRVRAVGSDSTGPWSDPAVKTVP